MNQLNEEELEKVSEMLKVSDALEGKEPILTDADPEDIPRLAEDEEGQLEDGEEGDAVDELEVNSRRVVLDDQASSVSRQVSQSAHSAINSL